MRTKSELKEKLFELKKQIKLNSKDAHWTENAMRDFESLVGQIKHEPIVLDTGKELDEWAGKTFKIVKTTHGVLFHTFGGYSVFCTPNNTSLYQTLVDYVERRREFETFTDEQKEIYELTLDAVANCVTLPMHVFSDAEFMYKIATEIIKHLNELTVKAMDAPLNPETEEERKLFESFKETQIGVSELVEQMGEEIRELKKND